VAVVLGAAVTTAVLTGALLVGDSVRGSLRDLTLSRLGGIDYSFVSPRLLREEWTADLGQDPLMRDRLTSIAPLLLLPGSVRHPGLGRRASDASIHGVDERFLEFFPEFLRIGPQLASDSEGLPPVVINAGLQEELGAEVGDQILVSFGRRPSVNPEFALGSRKSLDLQGTVRATLVEVVPDTSLGRFSLRSHQAVPHNIFIGLDVLQEAAEQEGMANVFLMSGEKQEVGALEASFYESLQKYLTLADLGLKWRSSGGEMILESRELIISPSMEQNIRMAAVQVGLQPQVIFTYLANSISSDQTIPYSTVTALDLEAESFRESLRLVSGEPAPELGDDEILLDKWAATELGAREGDLLTLTYYVVDWKEDLSTLESHFRLRGIVEMGGLAIDQTLTPEIPGVQDAADMASWDPPIPIDLDLIRPQDEEYWDEYRSAPKAFVSYSAGAEMWQSRFGTVTSFRFKMADTSGFERALLGLVDPESLGYFQAVKEQGVQAAVGATDFGMLFIGFSLFLIVSAVLLVALLFRLGVETRVREIGALLSIGYRLRQIRLRFLLEAFLLSVVGAFLGLIGAVGYAWLLIAGLQSLWVAAIGSSFLDLHVEGGSLVIGLIISVTAILISIYWVFRSLSRLPVTSLLAGSTSDRSRGRVRLARVLLIGSVGTGVVLILIGFLSGVESSAGVFFGIGTSLLVAGFCLFSLWLHREQSGLVNSGGVLGSLQMAVRNSARNAGRSLLSTILVGTACFVIVAVGANRSHASQDLEKRTSGTGGFLLQARSDVPLVRDLNDADALFDLGFSDPDAEQLATADIMPFRALPGDDVSCRNLYQPSSPGLLGVPRQQIDRGGFRFQGLIREADNPWALLEEDLGPEIIPAFGDANSVMWILHKSLGEDIVLTNEEGREIRLRLVGLLARSIFQSELLISEANFQKHFPSRSGYSFFLIDASPAQRDQLGGILESNLERFGFDVSATSQVLEGYLSVENTYLSTFQTLGGLGLLLGTLGLAIILIRNTIERTGELATLSAFGFSRRKLSVLVLSENCFLLVLGILLGTVSALLAVAPHVLVSGSEIPWVSLFLTLIAVFVTGTVASAISVHVLSKRPLLAALRQE
jgi:ABC-type lipoprotein release transport system permease subunit